MTTRRLRLLRRPLPALAALVLVGLALAGCGGSDKAAAVAGAAGTDGRAAQAFPPSSVAFFDANIDEDSAAWKRLLTLAERFPSWPKAVADLEKSIESDARAGDPTFAEVRAWLGSEAAIGVLDVPADGSDPSWLGFADVRDRSAIEASFKKNKDTEAAGTHGGFDLLRDTSDNSVAAVSADTLLIGNSQAVVEAGIDRLAGTGDRLSDLATFKDTLATLPSDNLAVGYAPGSVVRKLVQLGKDNDPTGRSSSLTQVQFDQIYAKLAAGVRSFGFSLDATDKGLRTRWTTLYDGTQEKGSEPYTPELLARVPANSWFAASVGNLGDPLSRGVSQVMKSNPEAQKQVSGVEAMLGIKLEDLYALLSGETALYAGPGVPVSGGVILRPQDSTKGAATLRVLTGLLAQQGIKFENTADGQTTTIQGFTVRWRSVDDVIAIGSNLSVGDVAADSIADSDKFKRILDEDGVGSDTKTLGLAYFDVPSLVDLASAFGAFNGADGKEALENLRHVGGVLFWRGQDSDTVTNDLFVEST
jgi:hypothetical protein